MGAHWIFFTHLFFYCLRNDPISWHSYLKAMAEENRTGTTSSVPEKKDVKSPNLIERAKEEVEAVFHGEKSPRHHKETHGTSDDIDENTPVDEVKGPGIFHRVKEEVEALVQSVLPKK